MHPFRVILSLWRTRWGLLRLAIACAAMWVLLADTAPRLARLQLASLAPVDYLAEIDFLRAAGRYGEALVVADAALEDPAFADPASVESRKAAIAAESDSLLRRAREVGAGAITGQGRSLESLLGAVAADFFVIGDVRDIVIQGSRLAVDGEADELILALSAVGIATTFAPHIDWAPAVLKAARKTGAMTDAFASSILRTARSGPPASAARALEPVLRDTRTLASAASPGGAVRLLRHADDPADLAAMARFVDRAGASPAAGGKASAAFALNVTGKEGVTLLRSADGAETLLITAARKGDAGRAWLRTGGRALLRPHPLVGIAKGMTKGTLPEALAQTLLRLQPHAPWLIPALAAWIFLEFALLALRLFVGPPSPRAAPSPT